ncbi:MAG: ribosome maturation factor RimP [Synechococcales cyanobacterium RM1_1_8]|nr:ribosome maturation factor RimP [Synechococcales cyanobacterium RM1_1_8]
MSHPIIPQVLELAEPIAAAMALEVVGAVFQTNQSPPVLRLDLRSLEGETSLDHCSEVSRSLEAAIEAAELLPDAYVLEVSSPGLSDLLSQDRDFVSFRGFPVRIETLAPHRGQTRWEGTLMRRDDDHVLINQKGRPIKIPRDLVREVRLSELS